MGKEGRRGREGGGGKKGKEEEEEGREEGGGGKGRGWSCKSQHMLYLQVIVIASPTSSVMTASVSSTSEMMVGAMYLEEGLVCPPATTVPRLDWSTFCKRLTVEGRRREGRRGGWEEGRMGEEDGRRVGWEKGSRMKEKQGR